MAVVIVGGRVEEVPGSAEPGRYSNNKKQCNTTKRLEENMHIMYVAYNYKLI